jgi:phosphoglycolate phosphatase
MQLVLFDIDGTLVHTGGAGKRAFNSALEDVLGICDGLRDVRLDGKTDLLILEEVLLAAGRPTRLPSSQYSLLYDRYIELLLQELERDRLSYRIYEGVVELLQFLDGRKGVAVGLATGNLERGARAKLEPGRLNRFFPFGGFGSDSADRTALIRKAIERGAALADGEVSDVVVIGDTPRDVSHGREAGARVLAVATGSYSVTDLADCRADLVVEQLHPTPEVVEFIETGG